MSSSGYAGRGSSRPCARCGEQVTWAKILSMDGRSLWRYVESSGTPHTCIRDVKIYSKEEIEALMEEKRKRGEL